MRRLVSLVMLSVVVGLSPTRAGGDELRTFSAAVAEAYAHYRQTLFYLRTGNSTVAGLELDDFTKKWNAVIERFGAAPPAPYSHDPAWAQTLAKIRARAEQALATLDGGETAAATEALSPVRGLLSEMRRRNGVVTFSDHVDELSAAMDTLVRYRRSITDLNDDSAVEPVRRRAAVVEYLFEKIRLRAPAEVARQEEFQRTLRGARESLGRLWRSFETRNIRLYRIGIGELRAHERLLYLRFG